MTSSGPLMPKRKLIGGVFQSLDGVMQAPGGPPEDPTGGFELGGWTATYFDETLGAAMGRLFDGPFDLLLGRKTYEIFAAHWPYVGDEDPMGAAFTRANKFVVTGGSGPFDWANTHRLRDVHQVAEIKARPGPDLLIQGSSTLYPPLLADGLIDRLQLMTFPVVLGHGKRLFGAGTPPGALTLVDHAVSTTGVVIATYAPAGAVPIGSFELPEPSPAELARRERMKREG